MNDNFQIITNKIAKAQEIFNQLDVPEATRVEYKARIPAFLSFIDKSDINYNSYLEFKRYLAGRADFSVSIPF